MCQEISSIAWAIYDWVEQFSGKKKKGGGDGTQNKNREMNQALYFIKYFPSQTTQFLLLASLSEQFQQEYKLVQQNLICFITQSNNGPFPHCVYTDFYRTIVSHCSKEENKLIESISNLLTLLHAA